MSMTDKYPAVMAADLKQLFCKEGKTKLSFSFMSLITAVAAS